MTQNREAGSPRGENHRVTLAVLNEKLDHISKKLDVIVEQQSRDHDRLLRAEGDIRVLREHVSLGQAGQAVLTIIASAIAAFLGTRH